MAYGPAGAQKTWKWKRLVWTCRERLDSTGQEVGSEFRLVMVFVLGRLGTCQGGRRKDRPVVGYRREGTKREKTEGEEEGGAVMDEEGSQVHVPARLPYF